MAQQTFVLNGVLGGQVSVTVPVAQAGTTLDALTALGFTVDGSA